MPPRIPREINPCGIEGHKIESLKKGVRFLPGNVIVDDVIVVCTRCCRTLEEIRAEMNKADGPKEAPVANP